MKHASYFFATGIALGLAACTGSLGGGGSNDPNDPNNPTPDEWEARLGERVLDYSAALRTAALRLTGNLPTLAEIKQIASASDQAAKKAAYEALINQYVDRPEFAAQMVEFWKDAFKMGGTPLTDSAGIFAAQLAVENRSYMELLTATTGTCPTFNAGNGTFAAANCNNGVATHAGLLTHPGMNAHFFSNMAFRRARWVQETFACTAFPAEASANPVEMGAGSYAGLFDFDSISGTSNGGRIDFLDTSSVVCANCHSTMNHLTPLFAYFDEAGQQSGQMAVPTPLDGTPLAQPSDYVPAGEPTAWRFGMAAANLPALGVVMAQDPDVAECAIARLWNWSLGKGDIVDTLSIVPSAIIADQVGAFTQNGYKLRDAIVAVYTSDDFVRF